MQKFGKEWWEYNRDLEHDENYYAGKRQIIDNLGLDGLYNYLSSFEIYVVPEKKEKWHEVIKRLIYDNEVDNIYDYRGRNIDDRCAYKICYKDFWYDYIQTFITVALLMQADIISNSDQLVLLETLKDNGAGIMTSPLIEILMLDFAINGYKFTTEFYSKYSLLNYNQNEISKLKKEAKAYSENKREAHRVLVKKLKQVLYKKNKEENIDYEKSGMNLEYLRQHCSWEYQDEYKIYNAPSIDLLLVRCAKIAMPEYCHNYICYSISNELYAFVSISEQLEGIMVGISLKPDLCGQGIGKYFLKDSLQEIEKRYPGKKIQLEVQSWNERAIKAYSSVGFVITEEVEKEKNKQLIKYKKMEKKDI